MHGLMRLCLVGGIMLASSTEAATVTRGPYLQMGSSNRITVRWRTDVATNSRVIYGITQGSLTSAVNDAASVTEHEVTITALSANTKYFYAVGTSTTILAGNDANHFFLTAPTAGTAKPTRIWVLGDAGTATSSQTAVKNAYYAYTGSRHTDLWMMLGDNAYSTGTDSEYQAAVFNMYSEMLRKSVLWSTVGNHDTASSTTYSASYPYFQSFTFPTNAEAGGLASGTEQYYSFDYANIHFVCLDSMTSNRATTGPMATWLTNDLASNNKAWTIVFFHHPPYTKGSHNSDTESQLVQMRTNILPILESAGVDLVLCGHSHSYERSYLLDGHYGLSTTLTSAMKKDGGSGRQDGTGAYRKATIGSGANEGAVYAVAGSSGKISGGTLDHPAMFVSLNVLGSMVVDVNGNQLDAKFLDNLGAVRDYFTIIKGSSSDTQVPTAPANLALVSRTDTSISMNWTASTDNVGVTGYHVYRNGVDVGVTTTTNFTNNGLVAGTNYSYTVKARDAAGNLSAASNILNTSTTSSAVTLVAAGSTWKYLDNGSNQGTAWRAMFFNDSAWASGSAQFGYGDGGEATVVSFGPDSTAKYITTYFRRAFTVADPSFSALTLRVLRDDGAVVYLNGTEVYRTNMPAGTITSSTLASTAVGGADESTFYQATIPTSLLVMGTNVLAVEIHQSSATSSDVSFDLSLAGTPGTNTNDAPLVATAATASPSPVTGITTSLSVLGADDFGEPNLTYSWATTGTPPAAVSFSPNGTNAAKTSTATFSKIGTYSFQVSIRDQGNLTATSTVNVTVNATLTSVTISPTSANLALNATQQFTASAKDQFNAVLSTQPSFTWTRDSGGVGTVSATGLYSAGATAGTATVRATSGLKSGTASVTVFNNNLAPVAQNSSITTPKNIPVNGTLQASDANNDPLTFAIVANGSKGSVVINNANTGTFTYTPNQNQKGGDVFTFRANDGKVNSNTATVSVTLTNTKPNSSNLALTTTTTQSLQSTLPASDTDGDVLTYSIVTNGTLGEATIIDSSTGAFTYTPFAGSTGTDTITFQVSDGDDISNLSTVTIVINGVLAFTSVPTAGPNPALVGQTLQFSAPVTGASADAVWTWEFGDGTSSNLNGASTSHVYNSAGSMNVSVSINDGGQQISGTLQVIIYDGNAAMPNIDTDGDGVSDGYELMDRTNPLDSASMLTMPYTVLKAAGSLNFAVSSRDSCSASGIIPGIPDSFEPRNASITLNIGGVASTFVLDAKGKGRGKTHQGSVALKLPFSKKDPITRAVKFIGGNVPFKVKLARGNFVSAWADEGINSGLSAVNQQMPLTINVMLAGRVYGMTVDAIYSVRANRGAKFKFSGK
jgi:acid phosphatase type 7